MPRQIVFLEEKHDGSIRQHRIVENEYMDVRVWDWHQRLKANGCRFEATSMPMQKGSLTLEVVKKVGGEVLAWRVANAADPYPAVEALFKEAVKALAA